MVSGWVLACPRCSASFSSRRKMRRHLTTVHRGTYSNAAAKEAIAAAERQLRVTVTIEPLDALAASRHLQAHAAEIRAAVEKGRGE